MANIGLDLNLTQKNGNYVLSVGYEDETGIEINEEVEGTNLTEIIDKLTEQVYDSYNKQVEEDYEEDEDYYDDTQSYLDYLEDVIDNLQDLNDGLRKENNNLKSQNAVLQKRVDAIVNASIESKEAFQRYSSMVEKFLRF